MSLCMSNPENNKTRTPFLKQVARYYHQHFQNNYDFCFVFPNRRSGQFFLKDFEDCCGENSLLPFVTTIADFVEENTDKTLATPTELIFNLYQAYCEVTKNPNYEFDKFIHWGNILVSDFNDVDQYMVDAKQLFTNISDWKDIATDYIPDDLKKELQRYLNINFEESADDFLWKNNGSNVKGKFTSLWGVLYPLYLAYNQHLNSKHLSYQGKMLREFATKINDLSNDELPFDRYVFVGFNLLSTSEMLIFDAFKKKGIADFHWDNAASALQNTSNKGHKHIAMLSKRYRPAFKLDAIDESSQNINVEGISTAVGQTKYAFSIVEGLIESGAVKKEVNGIDTAIVLPDESLFAYLANSIPANIPSINATLGIPLRNSDISSLIRSIAKAHKNAYRPGTERYFRFYKEFVKEILSHPIVKSLYPIDVTNALNFINSSTEFYISEDYFSTTKLADIFTTIHNTTDERDVLQFIDRLISLCNQIWAHNRPVNIDEKEKLSLQSTFALQYVDILNETKELIREYGIPMCASSVFYLFDKLSSLYTVPFEGEPLSGLQIMGMLETRNLDFDNLVILSMNERVFPRKFFKNSFIPPNMRRHYYMSTIDEQESMSAYYFYRLISRAKNVYLLYDTSVMGIGSSEYSRFISQLEMLYGRKIHFRNISLQVNPEAVLKISVNKDDDIYNKIMRYAASDETLKRLSASSIKTYIKCPLKFYFKHIEGLADDNEESQFMDYATFGTIIHDTLEAFYFPEEVKMSGGHHKVTKAAIKAFKSHGLKRSLIRHVNKIYLHNEDIDEPLAGETAITLRALLYYAEQVLDYDLGLLKSDTDFFMVYECELQRNVSLEIGNQPFNFTYKIDRLDRINDEGPLRVIDYKTGQDKVSFKEVSDIVSNKDHGHYLAIMQLFLYCNALKTENPDWNMGYQPIIYKIKEMETSGISHKKGNKDNVFDFDALNEQFLETMGSLMNGFFDKNKPFEQCENNNNAECKYCKFIEFCRR